MRSQGLDAELVIGTRSGATGIRAHAWVEALDRRFDESGELAHTVIQRF